MCANWLHMSIYISFTSFTLQNKKEGSTTWVISETIAKMLRMAKVAF